MIITKNKAVINIGVLIMSVEEKGTPISCLNLSATNAKNTNNTTIIL